MPRASLGNLRLGAGTVLNNFHHCMSCHIPSYVIQAVFLWPQHFLRISSKGFPKDS